MVTGWLTMGYLWYNMVGCAPEAGLTLRHWEGSLGEGARWGGRK
jgi:hypothetical protein